MHLAHFGSPAQPGRYKREPGCRGEYSTSTSTSTKGKGDESAAEGRGE